MDRIITGIFSFVYAIFLACVTEKLLNCLMSIFCTVLVRDAVGIDAIALKLLAALLSIAIVFGGIMVLTNYLCEKVSSFVRRFE